MSIRRAFVLCCLCLGLFRPVGAEPALRVAVLDNSPSMSFRDDKGQLTGFTVELLHLLCAELKRDCRFEVSSLDQAQNGLIDGRYDLAGMALLDTPERRRRLVLSKPFFRSVSLWFGRAGQSAEAAGQKVAVVRGSAQERYAQEQGWQIVAVNSNGELDGPLLNGDADAALIPMATALGLMQRAAFRDAGLQHRVIDPARLAGEACFGIAPARASLKQEVDAALERIKRSGAYDRINSKFIPFRVY